MVAGAELLDLPRPVRLEGVRREDELGAGELLGEEAREVAVPRVPVDDVGVADGPGHREVAHERVHEFGVARVANGDLGGGLDAAHAEVAGALVLRAEAEHVHVVRAAVEPGELAGEVLDVDAGPAVDVRRVLVREDRDMHG